MRKMAQKMIAIAVAMVIVLGMASVTQMDTLAASYSFEGEAHVQTYGDRAGVYRNNTLILGTTGQAKRLERIKIKFNNQTGYDGSIEYRVHRQTNLERLRSIIRFVTGCISRRMDGVRAGSMMARSRVLRAKRRDSKVWKCSWFRSLRRWDWCTAYIARRTAGRHRTKRWDRLAAQRAKENDWKASRSL